MEILLAAIPILALIIMMGIFKMSSDKSSVITLVITVGLAVWYFGLSWGNTGMTFLYGATKAVFPILFVILMAIYSYNVLVATGKINVLKEQFSTISTDRSVQVLLITWGFGGLLEGMAGFGTAVAIPAAILISLGYKPLFSALVSLIANSVPTAFGAVGVPVIVLGQQADLPAGPLSATVVLQLAPLMILVPFVITFLTDSSKKVIVKNIILSVLVGAVSLVVQYFTARYVGAELPAIAGALASIIVILIAGKIIEHGMPKAKSPYTLGQGLQAWAVYLLILGFVLITCPLFPSIRNFLNSVLVTNIHYPILGDTKTVSIQWLTQGGVLLFLGSFIGGIIQGANVGHLWTVLGKSCIQLWQTVVTVISLVAFSSIMEYAGMTFILAEALATSTGMLYPMFAPLIGALGTFLTGSDTSANIMFGKLQATVAGQLGIDPNWLAAANTAGATGGKIISPQSISIATSACNTQGTEGIILKNAFPYALAYVLIAGAVVWMF